MPDKISIIIPNYNGSATIGMCLDAALSVDYPDFEVVVVDDCSTDNSWEIIQNSPCRSIRLDCHAGAAKARNAGADMSRGEVLFFIDADCILQRDAPAKAVSTLEALGRDTIVGGTYTALPHDMIFFSIFQSIFVNYFESKNAGKPDYVATHAMVIDADLFKKSGGFPEDFMPILEDVEFSHRMVRQETRLFINPEILVRHVFNFSLSKSLKNAVRKSLFWTAYSVRNRDVFVDSGTASHELKANVVLTYLKVFLLFCAAITQNFYLILPLPALAFANIATSRNLLAAFFNSGGAVFGMGAFLYYVTLYPLAVGAGAGAGTLRALTRDN